MNKKIYEEGKIKAKQILKEIQKMEDWESFIEGFLDEFVDAFEEEKNDSVGMQEVQP